MTETRRRYEMLFGLLLNSGLRISEALGLKASDVRLVEGTAKSVRVIGKGQQGTPGAFQGLWRVFGFWLKDRNRGEAIFAKADGQPVSAQAARAYLRLMLKKAGIDKKVSHTNCVILMLPTCSTLGQSWWTSRPCSVTRVSPPPRFIPTWGRSGWRRWWGDCESNLLV